MLAKGIYSSSAITYKALTNNKIILLRGSTSSWSTPELPLALGYRPQLQLANREKRSTQSTTTYRRQRKKKQRTLVFIASFHDGGRMAGCAINQGQLPHKNGRIKHILFIHSTNQQSIRPSGVHYNKRIDAPAYISECNKTGNRYFMIPPLVQIERIKEPRSPAHPRNLDK